MTCIRSAVFYPLKGGGKEKWGRTRGVRVVWEMGIPFMDLIQIVQCELKISQSFSCWSLQGIHQNQAFWKVILPISPLVVIEPWEIYLTLCILSVWVWSLSHWCWLAGCWESRAVKVEQVNATVCMMACLLGKGRSRWRDPSGEFCCGSDPFRILH